LPDSCQLKKSLYSKQAPLKLYYNLKPFLQK